MWHKELITWLENRGYKLNESGPINPTTGRGWYSHPCEYKLNHVRVRINEPKGIIVLRDPGCTLQIERGNEYINPNMCRIDYSQYNTVDSMQRTIEGFEKRLAYTAEEAYEYFFGNGGVI